MGQTRKKKLEYRVAAVTVAENVKAAPGGTYKAFCGQTGIAERSLWRWREQQRDGKPLLSVPGPSKTEPLDLVSLFSELLDLKPGRKRTGGADAFYRKFQEQLSRRVVRDLTRTLRLEYWRRVESEQRRVSWLSPGLIWSMDDTEMLMELLGLMVPDLSKVYWNQVRDLASLYQFEPVSGPSLANGEIVAAHLEELFEKYGAPLIMKLDNHGNLNNWHVARVLGHYFVIPLNSPTYYAPYNGTIEEGQGEFKRMVKNLCRDRKWPRIGREEALEMIQVYSELAALKLNQKPRPKLGGASSCANFEVGRQDKRYYYDRRQREEVFTEIKAIAKAALAEARFTGQRAADAAWRLAVETWLRREGLITVSVGGKVLPYFA